MGLSVWWFSKLPMQKNRRRTIRMSRRGPPTPPAPPAADITEGSDKYHDAGNRNITNAGTVAAATTTAPPSAPTPPPPLAMPPPSPRHDHQHHEQRRRRRRQQNTAQASHVFSRAATERRSIDSNNLNNISSSCCFGVMHGVCAGTTSGCPISPRRCDWVGGAGRHDLEIPRQLQGRGKFRLQS